MILKIKKLREDAVIPARGTQGSAGFDLSAAIDGDIVIAPGEIAKIPTGISAEIGSSGYALLIYARSGLATKFGIAPANCVGVVDSDYRGEIIVSLINHGSDAFTVTQGMRIAQMILTPVCIPELEVCGELSDTQRGSGGFGSTGTDRIFGEASK